MADAKGDRSRSGNHHQPRACAGARNQRDQRVVDDERVRSIAEPPHDVANGAAIGLAIDPGHAEAHRRGRDVAAARDLFDHVVEDFLDLELAFGLEVGAAGAAVGDDATVAVGEERHRLRAAGIDAENVHAD